MLLLLLLLLFSDVFSPLATLTQHGNGTEDALVSLMSPVQVRF